MSLTEQIEKVIDEHVYAVTRHGEAWVEGIDEAAAAVIDELELDK